MPSWSIPPRISGRLPFALLFLPAGLALFGGAGLRRWRCCFWQDGRGAAFGASPSAMPSAEWLRGHVLTGFPWNLPAYGWGASLAVLQSAALIGAYGLSFLTILLGASLAELFARRAASRLPARDDAALFALSVGFGAVRLAATPTADVPGVQLRLVQPDIPQGEKYVAPLCACATGSGWSISAPPPGATPTHIIWPEAAPPFLLDALAGGAGSDRAADRRAAACLITGADRVATTGGRGATSTTAFISSVPAAQLLRDLRQIPSGAVRRICAVRAAARIASASPS